MDENTKVVATFNAFDAYEVELFSHAVGYSSALWDIQGQLRSWTKHGHKFTSADEALDAVYALFFDARRSYHLPEC